MIKNTSWETPTIKKFTTSHQFINKFQKKLPKSSRIFFVEGDLIMSAHLLKGAPNFTPFHKGCFIPPCHPLPSYPKAKCRRLRLRLRRSNSAKKIKPFGPILGVRGHRKTGGTEKCSICFFNAKKEKQKNRLGCGGICFFPMKNILDI